MATVRADAADVHEGLRMLPKLPAVSHIEFVERTVGVEDLELLTTVPNLSMVVLTRCSYDPRKVLKFIASHPAIQISASGHDAFLGVSLQPAEMDDPFEASSLPEESAAPGQRTYCRVATVVEDSAASRAGIREGDVILELDNYPISSFSELVVVIASHQPGDSIPIRFVQDGEPRDASITLGSRPPGQ